MGEVAIRGQVISLDTREIRNEKTIIIISVTDFTDTIVLKIFSKNEDVPELLESIKKGAFLKIKGVTTIDKFDSELTIGSIRRYRISALREWITVLSNVWNSTAIQK